MMISSSDVASPSSTPPPRTIDSLQNYEVFISFRGSDTRHNFTSHLYNAIDKRGIFTFIDDELRRGDPISTLFSIIENSKISVVILSPNYASSKWCLKELVKILDCKETDGHIVIPVFYNVDPSEVKKQTGNYAKAFTEEHDGNRSPETIQKWRNALREVSELSGWDTAVTRPDAVLTEKIANDVFKKLNGICPNHNTGLVGIDSKIEAIESMIRSADCFAVGIWGVGGIGKTTLARATFDKIFTEFEDAYFIDNISEISKVNGGLSRLAMQLFSSMSGGNEELGYISNFTLVRLRRKKVIIVFDDVSDSLQIEEIVGPLESWNNTRSRFIITSRDKQVFKYLGYNKAKIYRLNGLFDDEALQLFSRCAFKQEFPMIKYMDLSKRVIEYARGVPLALKVLGLFLCGRSKQEWESAVEKLEKIPHAKIQEVLKISYDGLEEDQKKIFLDIACFFQRASRDFLVRYFAACDFNAEIELAVLIEKCLIESCFGNDQITMHDLIRRMGKNIVRQESTNNPGKRSRLWHHKDIEQVLRGNMGTEAIEGISLDSSMIDDINLEKNAFENMKKLRLLNLLNLHGRNKVHMPWGPDSILNELRYLRWDGFPLKSLQPNFILEKLVDLHIHYSNIEQLWGGVQPLLNLQTISLMECKELTAIPDLSKAHNLHELYFRICANLRILPSCGHLKFLTDLDIVWCPKLEVIPELPSNLEKLHLYDTKIEELQPSIGHLSRLEVLSISSCPKLKSLPHDLGDVKALISLQVQKTPIEALPPSICKLKSLKSLFVLENEKLATLPRNIGDIKSLQMLWASSTTMEELPSSICKLKSLYILIVSYNKELARLPQNIGDLKSLQELDASHTAIEELPTSICKLKSLEFLHVSNNEKLTRLPQNIGDLKSLRELDASHTAIEELPSSVGHLLALVKLSLCGAKLKCFSTCVLYLKSLEYLDLCGIEELKTLPHDLVNLGDLETSNFPRTSKAGHYGPPLQCCYKRHAISHEDLGNLKPVMEESPIWLYDAKLNCFPRNIFELKSLAELSPYTPEDYVYNPFGSLFDYLRDLEVLKFSDASGTSIGKRPLSLSYPGTREYLGLSNCGILKLPHNFGQLNFFKKLNLSSNEFVNLPASIIDLSQLESLNLSSCHRLQALPELPRNLYFLDASDCSSLKTLPSSSILFATFETCYPKCTLLIGCYKLDKDSIRAVTEYALLKPQLKVTAPQHDDFLKFQGYCLKNKREAYVIYPGSKIPEWFSSQSIGSLITVENPLGRYNRKIVGIAVCAVVNLPCSEIGFYYKFEDEDGQSKGSKSELFHGDHDYDTLKSLSAYHGYHVCIAYLPYNGSISQLKSMTVSIGFFVWRKKSSKETMTCFDVEACGVRFLYGQNLRKCSRGSNSIDEELGSPNKRVRGCRDEDYAESFSMVADSLSNLNIL